MYGGVSSYGELGELACAPISQHLTEEPTAVVFDPVEEALLIGTQSGWIHGFQCPRLERYWSLAAHAGPLEDMVPMVPGVLSVSSSTVRIHRCGGLPVLTLNMPKADLKTCAVRPHQGTHAVLGQGDGGLKVLDVSRGSARKPVASAQLPAHLTKLCHRPAGYGLLAAALATGEIVMLDAQSGLKPVHSPFMAHSGGVVDLDVREHLLISCGMSSSSASVYMPDPHVKVFDVRQIARPLGAMPFPAGPNLLRLHPRLYNQALVASASGVIYMAEVPSSGLVSATYRLSAPGAPLLACDISSSGEIVAFACRGLTYLWGTSHSPHVNHGGTPAELPPAHRPPVTPLSSNSSFADAPAYYPMDGRLLSDLPPYLQLSVGKPPRTVDASLAANIKMDDFVGHVANPMFKRGMAAGTAAAGASRLRRRRVQPRSSLQATEQQERERRRQQRLEQGWELLPEQYSYHDLRSVTQRTKPGSGGSTTSGPSRFIDDVDWSLYNNTCFAGLENDIPNAYCNALLQVLYFIPEVRSAMMVQIPSPTVEFSITDELSLLFRMLACPQQQQPVRASNLLRALKHTREASALGLLEGGNEPRDVMHKDMSLTRRVQSLSLFILTLLQKEASAAPTEAARMSPRCHRRVPAAAGPSASAAPGANGGQAAPNFVESVLGMGVTVRMQSLQTASAPELIRSDIMLQIDLRYPPLPAGGTPSAAEPAAKPNGISDTSAESAAQKAASSSTQPKEKAGKDGAALPHGRLPFAQVLKNSLVDRKEMRAWFNNSLGYQYVRQQRAPTSLPKVLMVNCLEPSPEMRFHWDPAAAAAADAKGKLGGAPPASGPSKPWLPWFVRISTQPARWEVQVAQADSLEELASEPQLEGEGVSSATYELMAVIAHVKDADVGDAADGQGGQRGPAAGHLVAHIKVGKEYWQDAEAYAAEAGDGTAALSPRSATEGGLLTSPMPTPPRPGAPPQWGSRTEAAPGGRTQVKSGILPETLDDSPVTSPRQLLPGWAGEAAVPQEEDVEELQLAALPDEPAGTADDTAGSPEAEHADAAGLADASADAVSSSPAAEEPGGAPDTQWVLFNDWSIQTTPAEEARRLYSFQKLPAVAVYARVEDQPSDSSATPPRPSPVPVLTPKSFEQLCRAPPVNPKSTNPRWWKFKPLELSRSEMLGPECVLGLDAEFVALLPPERAMRDGLQVEVRPMTLGLARISVVRGAGPRAGQCCIDDYIRTVEPVYDYLYQYSGVKPGDLHPNTSSCFLTTLKAAYLKLRFLIDSGCIFVGHGLRQDFRMINIVVARRQIIDTVELFRFKRRRKLSLRFLASYLLGVNIQSSTHDSIEDARTALRLYEAYCRLVKAGELEEKLHEIYEWGTLHGWEPIQRGPSAAATGGLPAPAPV